MGYHRPKMPWLMGYHGIMSYVVDFPASQLGRWTSLWVMGGYGFRQVWVITVSTVDTCLPSPESAQRNGQAKGDTADHALPGENIEVCVLD